MPKLPTLHSYSDQISFDRLLLLISTLVQHPGVGSRTAKEAQNQDSLIDLQQHMQQVAQSLGLNLPPYSVHTLRKDLATLRDYEILERSRHDWGYYLGTGAMNRDELQLALNALASQATYQADPQARQIYKTLCQRLKCLNLDTKGELFYPVRAHFNRSIVPTDPEEMMRQQQNRDTLFHCIETLETAIVQGLPIELYQFRNPYQQGMTSYRQVYPLQLLYHDIAWYLVMEDCDNGHLAIARMDRFKNYLKILHAPARGLEAQTKSLQAARQLLQNGWGLHLGNPDDQQLERQGKLPFVPVKVRFFPPASRFIEEGEYRHPNQKIVPGPMDENGERAYVDYRVKLPRRSLDEFSRWVFRHLGNAQVLSPPELAQRHQQAAMKQATRYQIETG